MQSTATAAGLASLSLCSSGLALSDLSVVAKTVLICVVSSQLNHARGRWILLPRPGGGQGPSPDKMERNVFVLSKDETCVSLLPSD